MRFNADTKRCWVSKRITWGPGCGDYGFLEEFDGPRGYTSGHKPGPGDQRRIDSERANERRMRRAAEVFASQAQGRLQARDATTQQGGADERRLCGLTALPLTWAELSRHKFYRDKPRSELEADWAKMQPVPPPPAEGPTEHF